uniref:PARP catalytic domain-containing protein n=1 Tax=Neogobius melanostomus TaxID=47308 RepID=A0A8C6U9C1_9GOBI
MSYRWAEEDFELPPGVERLGSAAPKNNRSYVMYHGTSSSSAKKILKSGLFKPSADGMLGPGVYLSRDLQKASRYPLKLPEKDRVVIKVKVNVGKVKRIDYQGHPQQKTWYSDGFDTAWVPPNCGMVPSGLEEDCVWDPKRIQIVRAIKPQPEYRGGAAHYYPSIHPFSSTCPLPGRGGSWSCPGHIAPAPMAPSAGGGSTEVIIIIFFIIIILFFLLLLFLIYKIK